MEAEWHPHGARVTREGRCSGRPAARLGHSIRAATDVAQEEVTMKRLAITCSIGVMLVAVAAPTASAEQAPPPPSAMERLIRQEDARWNDPRLGLAETRSAAERRPAPRASRRCAGQRSTARRRHRSSPEPRGAHGPSHRRGELRLALGRDRRHRIGRGAPRRARSADGGALASPSTRLTGAVRRRRPKRSRSTGSSAVSAIPLDKAARTRPTCSRSSTARSSSSRWRVATSADSERD